jgi:cytoskeletal protein RodZ
MKPDTPLAKRLAEAIAEKHLTVEQLADRTKVHRSTLLALLEEPINAVIPPRIYLRGHTLVVARELGIPVDEAASLFDESYPEGGDDSIDLTGPRFPRAHVALAAGLGSIAILALVLAIVR